MACPPWACRLTFGSHSRAPALPVTDSPTPRWHERLRSFQRALGRLEAPIAQVRSTGQLPENLSAEFKDEVDRKFEMAYELGWQTLLDYFQYAGLPAPDDYEKALDIAHSLGLIEYRGSWTDLFESLHRTIETYSQRKSQIIFGRVVYSFYDLLSDLSQRLAEKAAQHRVHVNR